MSSAPLLKNGFEQFLEENLAKELLRFSTAGSVDDGKSTLIGRLLHDAKAVYEDQLAAVKNSRVNRSGGAIDFSLLTDGLRAEREQGITIDVAYRHFATARRKFIIADTPGHEQYTRNMATGASTASLAVVLVDASKGLLPQTRRHSYIASLLGIPTVLAAINKMDLAGYQEEVFERLQRDFRALAKQLKISRLECVPVSALAGDNIVERSRNMPWYRGPTLLEHLETVPIVPASSIAAIRFPVQYVIRPDAGFRGFAGQVSGGIVRPGDAVLALPSGQTTRVESIVTFDGQLPSAVLGQSVTLKLEDEIDISRGDMLVSPGSPPAVSRCFSAALVWLNERPMRPGHTYLLKHTTRQVKAVITRVHFRVNINTLIEETPTEESLAELPMNGIGSVEIETSSPLFFDAYELSRTTGSFILVDPLLNATVGAGMMGSDLSRGLEGSAPPSSPRSDAERRTVTPEERIARHGHRPAVFLIPSLLAGSVERALFERGFETFLSVESHASPAAVASLANSLWSAAFLILVPGARVSPEMRAVLADIAGDDFTDFTSVEAKESRDELLARILARAEYLRVAPGTSPLGATH
ncbi:MAG: sulfate adenylyltransferase subunit CysN [Candidatus Acidiferrum sp.]|jgi:bifunctional enzyme CysN/CysC/sulfate adenylyltransferase subunit 1